MFRVVNTVLGVLVVIALVLLVPGLALDGGLFGWVIAIVLSAYVIVAFVRARQVA